MWVPLPLCLLSALLATGSALLCEVCKSKEELSSGPLQLCAPLRGTCLIAVAGFNLGANFFCYVAKSCLAPKSYEAGPFTETFPCNITMRVNIAYCDTDGCNAGAIPGQIC
nr:phospholipase A2 inhibitor and Ly6/PLAUR domain-containing protein-like [Chrysemys picta bellii]